MGLHAVAGATAVQTIRDGSEVTLVWAVGALSRSHVYLREGKHSCFDHLVITILMWLPSNIRDFSSMTALGLVAAFTMLVCVLIVLCGHGVQGAPGRDFRRSRVELTKTMF